MFKTLKNNFSFDTDTSEFKKKEIFSDTKQNLRYSVNLEKSSNLLQETKKKSSCKWLWVIQHTNQGWWYLSKSWAAMAPNYQQATWGNLKFFGFDLNSLH